MKIVAAAIRANGVTMSIAAPARHHDILAAMPRKMARAVRPSEHGFLTSEGTFVRRSVALELARAAGQICEKIGNPDELFSEDVW